MIIQRLLKYSSIALRESDQTRYGTHGRTGKIRPCLSARAGHPVGWNYQSLIQTARRCIDIRPDFLLLLEACFSAFGRSSIFTDERYAEKWRAKRAKAVIDAVAKSDTRTDLLRLRQYRPAMEWLMPEVKHGIAATLAQLDPP
jgi:hypothetical protein